MRLEAILAALDATGDPNASLDALCKTSVEVLRVGGASVALLLADDDPCCLASSDERGRQLVDLQFSIGEGPCIDAHNGEHPVLVPDLAEVARWPIFTREAIAMGSAALFAFPLHVGAAKFGTLSLYRNRTGQLDQGSLADALTIADVACEITLCLQAEVPPGSFHQVIDNLLDQRAVVYQATGMVLMQLGVSPESALAALRARAYAEGRRLGEVSADVVARRLRFDL